MFKIAEVQIARRRIQKRQQIMSTISDNQCNQMQQILDLQVKACIKNTLNMQLGKINFRKGLFILLLVREFLDRNQGSTDGQISPP